MKRQGDKAPRTRGEGGRRDGLSDVGGDARDTDAGGGAGCRRRVPPITAAEPLSVEPQINPRHPSARHRSDGTSPGLFMHPAAQAGPPSHLRDCIRPLAGRLRCSWTVRWTVRMAAHGVQTKRHSMETRRGSAATQYGTPVLYVAITMPDPHTPVESPFDIVEIMGWASPAKLP